MQEISRCAGCRNEFSKELLAEACWYPFWEHAEGGCPACVQENLLLTLLSRGEAALHDAVQTHWPFDVNAQLGALPTRLRLHADPRYSCRGVMIAMVGSGFYPHPDLAQPTNRICAWFEATREETNCQLR
jgi:hypothetical protein